MSTTDIWTHRDTSLAGTDLTGYKIEAMDGSIGKIDEASNEVGASYLVVATGRLDLRQEGPAPAGAVDRVDRRVTTTVYVNRTEGPDQGAPSTKRTAPGRSACGQARTAPAAPAQPRDSLLHFRSRSEG